MMTDTQTPAAPKPRPKSRQPRRMTLGEYFRAEDRSLIKHEYHNGYRKPMAGGTFTHDNLAHKAAKLIDNFVEDFDYPYFVNGSDTKIRIDEADRTVYADAVVICEKLIFFEDRQDTIINPRIVVEVLSFSTQKFDRTDTFELYRMLPSFQEYVLIWQDKKKVTVQTRQPDTTWLLRDYADEDATAILYALHNCPLPLKRLYRGLTIEPQEKFEV